LTFCKVHSAVKGLTRIFRKKIHNILFPIIFSVSQKKPESPRHSPVPSPHRTPQVSPRREEESPRYQATESPLLQQKLNMALHSTPPRSPELERPSRVSPVDPQRETPRALPGRQVQVRDMPPLGPVHIHKKDAAPPDSSRSSQVGNDNIIALPFTIEDRRPFKDCIFGGNFFPQHSRHTAKISSMCKDVNFLGIPGKPGFSSYFRGFPELGVPIKIFF
jgi:hypothetical protein